MDLRLGIVLSTLLVLAAPAAGQPCVSDIAPSPAPADSDHVDLVWNGGELALLSEGEGGSLWFSLLSPSLGPLDASIEVASGAIPGTARLIWTNRGYGLFYRRSDARLYYVFLDPGGEPDDEPQVVFPLREPDPRQRYDADWRGDAFVVAETTVTFGRVGVTVNEVEIDGTVRSEDYLPGSVADQPHLDLEMAGERAMFVWDGRDTASQPESQVGYWDGAPDIPRRVFPFLEGTGGRLEWNGERLFIVTRFPTRGTPTTLLGAVTDADGRVTTVQKPLVEAAVASFAGLVWDGDEIALGVERQQSAGGLPDLHLLRFTDRLLFVSESGLAAEASGRNLTVNTPLVWTERSIVAGLLRRGVPVVSSLCPLEVTVSGPELVLRNDVATFEAEASGGISPYSYAWEIGIHRPPDVAGSTSYFFSTTLATTVRVTVTDGMGARATAEMVVNPANQPPEMSVMIDAPVTIQLGERIELTATVEGAVGAVEYRWVFDDGTEDVGPSTERTAEAAGVIQVELFATDSLGRTVSDIAAILVTPIRSRLVTRP